jgi:cytochrome c553
MEKRSKILLTSLFLTSVLVSVADASVAKGQKYYMKDCKACHGNGTKGASMNTQEGWSEKFQNGASALIKAHDGTGAKSYFNSDDFKKIAKDLEEFLFEYGSDSGNIPACG